MALLLIAAAGVSGFALGEVRDAAAILTIVVLNTAVGLVEEGRASRALEALRAIEARTARVKRGGRTVVIPAAEVVRDDLVLVSAGDRVPADLVLGSGPALEVDESLLTGESLPVTKGESDGVFSGTLITRGDSSGVVVATGAATELGMIAAHLREPSPTTPLQRELGRLAARLGVAAVWIAAALFGVVLLRAGALSDGFLFAVALAVAAVPEGLATVVTVGLALGVRRMAGRGALVRRLPAVETLGSTTVIATDKTGTLTANELRLDGVALAGGEPVEVRALAQGARARVVACLVLCNEATLEPPSGDPLEVGLLQGAAAAAVQQMRSAWTRVDASPFDPRTRQMAVQVTDGSATWAHLKGAPEAVVDRCASLLRADGSEAPLDDDARAEIARDAATLADRGIRVLALASRRVGDGAALDPALRDMTFLALAALRDPPRAEAGAAVAQARAAGIRIVMVTGDHPGTAAAIAREIGLADEGDRALTGADIEAGDLPADPASAAVYARVSPEQKLRLVEALRAVGHVVAVTGDGVNDAPALKRADIGVAMGRAGSDVAREASAMVITDDNLATIVAAVREGRGIYDNIRKVVDYLIAGNLSEITVVVAALVVFPGIGVPLLPLQLLWLNLLTDGLPAIALGVDTIGSGVMDRPPRPRAQRLLDLRRAVRLLGRGVVIAAAPLAALALMRWAWSAPWDRARGVMFTVLVVAHLLYAFVARFPDAGARVTRADLKPWRNKALLAAVGGGIVLQIAAMAVPPVASLLHFVVPNARELFVIVALGVLPVLVLAALRVEAGRRAN